MRCCSATSEGGRGWKVLFGSALLVGSLAVPAGAWAQERPPQSAEPTPPKTDTAPAGDAEDGKKAADTAASSTTPVTTPPRVAISTGAPQPTSQNQATPLPASVPATPSQAVVRVGGGMIILYNNNYAPRWDLEQGKKKHNMDVWRASIVLDSKLDRYGMHIELRARDRGLRWQPTNAWLEETYASLDILRPTNPSGPLTLKVGKSFVNFGKPWDNSFYGPVSFRDGLKLDASWGFSFEGAYNAAPTYGLKYWAQYYILDGQTGTVARNRDTISITQPGTANVPNGSRRRDRFVLRAEPYLKFGPTSVVRLGASFDHFIADFPDTPRADQAMRNPRKRELDNTEKVTRFGVDLTTQIKWVGAWAEYAYQDGMHTNAFPVAPRAANPTAVPPVAAANGEGYNKAQWFLVGANFTYDRYTIQYNHSQGKYENIKARDVAGQPRSTHREWIHNPSIQVALNEQLRLILEAPIWKRDPIPGLPTQNLDKVLLGNGSKETIEQQFIATLHGKF